MNLYITMMNTKIGDMICISDNAYLYLLEFADKKNLEQEKVKVCNQLSGSLQVGKTDISVSIEKELQAYFSGQIKQFKTPFKLIGTEFQKRVWSELCSIPFGETISYKSLARRIGNEKAFRAVANANGANHMPILIPCHRVINESGALGGYSGGLDRKKWLLRHETV